METIVVQIIYVIISYFIGAIPFGKIFSALAGKVNIQDAGSGNIGATNVARVVGAKWGIATFICDFGKGALIVYFARYVFNNESLAAYSAIVVVIGHCYPVYLKFKGGKGVATACGAFLVINPKAVAIALLIFVFVMLISRIVSLSSIIASMNFPVICGYLHSSRVLVIGALVTALIITYRHKSNIMRMLRGEEARFTFKKKNDSKGVA